ncbi:hypothetical protein AWE51_24065 [Aquimarina aggregata]|uniref:HTH araC/xylS-type domain-containing protein n=1 Tax=Aquimarina aggregata TaxID=1642818 RepID=A0A163B3N9_9FLAO|nr:AraC family transcriptional regulator [Aquimarina aggregata]KZS41030.1 hypothetical protein AWE51_24065 [Aquimarina aggregata]
MKIVPQAFYAHTEIEKVLVNGLSCVLLKNTKQVGFQNNRYLATHAITIVLNGQLRIEDSEGEITLVNKNQMILLPKGLYIISDIIPKNQSFDAIIYFFDTEIINEFLNTFPKHEGQEIPKTLVLNYDHNLRLFSDTLIALYRDKNQHQFTRPKLLELLHLISVSQKGAQFITKLQSLKNRSKMNVKSFMEENFDKPLDIKDYAYLTGRSISTFRRDFKSRFKISPKQWLIKKRLEKAAKLLEQKNDSITDIALQVGYENISHFIKAFQKEFKISPKQYQIKSRKDILI